MKGLQSSVKLAQTLVIALLVVQATACTRHAASPLSTPIAALKFDAPERDQWQKPELIVQNMNIQPGMTVVDLGAGSGYMLPYLSRAVGNTGHVIAVEVQPDFVAMLKQRIAAEELPNVEVIQSTDDGVPLLKPVERILLLDTYRELQQPVVMLNSLKMHLAPKGELFIVDARSEPDVLGPPLDERLELSTVIAEARGAGLAATLRFDILPRQFFITFVRAEEVPAATLPTTPPTAPPPNAATPSDAPAVAPEKHP